MINIRGMSEEEAEKALQEIEAEKRSDKSEFGME